MSTTVLLGLMSFEKIGGQWIFWGASDFSNLLAPRASGSRRLMLRAGDQERQFKEKETFVMSCIIEANFPEGSPPVQRLIKENVRIIHTRRQHS